MLLKDYVLADKDWKIVYNEDTPFGSVLPNDVRYACIHHQVYDLQKVNLTFVDNQPMWIFPDNDN